MNFKVGDQVYCSRLGLEGIVFEIHSHILYPIRVIFPGGKKESYTENGEPNKGDTQSLFHHGIEPQSTPKDTIVTQVYDLGFLIELPDGTKLYQSHSGNIHPLNTIKF